MAYRRRWWQVIIAVLYFAWWAIKGLPGAIWRWVLRKGGPK